VRLLLKRNVRGGGVGRRKVKSEEEFESIVLPVAKDVISIVTKMLGYDRIMVKCQDGHERLCRIRGKMKRKMWIRLGDIVLVSPWDFQSDKRGDVIWRYKRNQADWLRKKGYLKTNYNNACSQFIKMIYFLYRIGVNIKDD
jgi:translation initiation factor 1A